jgi:hypothetical protein
MPGCIPFRLFSFPAFTETGIRNIDLTIICGQVGEYHPAKNPLDDRKLQKSPLSGGRYDNIKLLKTWHKPKTLGLIIGPVIYSHPKDKLQDIAFKPG